MRTVLVTGMSGSGTSTALSELHRRGFEVVDSGLRARDDRKAATDELVRCANPG